MFRRQNDELIDGPTSPAKRGLGPFSGAQLTVIIVSLAAAICVPVGAWAVTASNVAVTDATTGQTARVTQHNLHTTVGGTVEAANADTIYQAVSSGPSPGVTKAVVSPSAGTFSQLPAPSSVWDLGNARSATLVMVCVNGDKGDCSNVDIQIVMFPLHADMSWQYAQTFPNGFTLDGSGEFSFTRDLAPLAVAHFAVNVVNHSQGLVTVTAVVNERNS